MAHNKNGWSGTLKKRGGFTLIELMIVVAIIGTLAMIGIPSYERYVIRSNRAVAKQFMLAVANKQEQYILDARQYTDNYGAGGLGLAGEVEKVAGGIPRFQKALVQTLGALSLDMAAHAYGGFKALTGEEQDHAISGVEQALPGPFGQFLELVYLVYYSDPRVHERIGWKTGPLQPVGFEMEPFDEGILENIRKRKPFWRQV